MNQLSLLLYLGGVASNLGPLFICSVIVAFATIVVCWIHYAFECDMRCHSDPVPVPPSDATRTLVLIALLFGVLAALCPSKDTVYAIAASQIGEQVIRTPLAGKAEKALESWLDKQRN